jgi:hypothetical protein
MLRRVGGRRPAARGPGGPAAADDVAVPAHDRVWGHQQPQSLAPRFRYDAELGLPGPEPAKAGAAGRVGRPRQVSKENQVSKEKESTCSSPLSTYSAPGGLPQGPGRATSATFSLVGSAAVPVSGGGRGCTSDVAALSWTCPRPGKRSCRSSLCHGWRGRTSHSCHPAIAPRELHRATGTAHDE